MEVKMTLQAKIVRAEARNPDVYESFLVTGGDSDGRFEWLEATVPFGQGPVYHIHHQADELFRVLDGELKVKLNGDYYDLKAGDVIFVPQGVPHTYTNVHPEQPVRMVGIYTPSGLQEFLSVWEKATANGMPDEATIAELGARFGQEACGPPLAVELGLFEGTK